MPAEWCPVKPVVSRPWSVVALGRTFHDYACKVTPGSTGSRGFEGSRNSRNIRAIDSRRVYLNNHFVGPWPRHRCLFNGQSV